MNKDDYFYGRIEARLEKNKYICNEDVLEIRSLLYSIQKILRGVCNRSDEYWQREGRWYFDAFSSLIKSAIRLGEINIWNDYQLHSKVKNKKRGKSVQLWKNGPYWAEMNIGAKYPWDSGYYFWWGDTVGAKVYKGDWIKADGQWPCWDFRCSPCQTSPWTFTDWITEEGTLSLEHDAARTHWGDGWRIPTKNDFEELLANTTQERMRLRGTSVYLIRGKGKYSSSCVFFPCYGIGVEGRLPKSSLDGHWGGVLWSSTVNWERLDFSWGFSYEHLNLDIYNRKLGIPIRPIRDSPE